MKSMTLTQFGELASRFLHRFHVIMFVVLVVGGLSLVTLFLNQAITKPASDLTTPGNQSFDEATMKKINNLRTTNDQANLTLPAGRSNPFVK